MTDIVEDTKNTPLADETDDSCVLRLIEIVPLDRTSDDDHKPEFIDHVVEVKPEDLQDVKQEPADDYKPEFIYPVVEVKPEDLQDVKQEPADDYNTEDPYFTIQVRSPSTCSTMCCRLMICFFQCGTFLPLDILSWTFPRPTQILCTLWILIPSIKVKI